jgi:hypothetical protein
MRALEKSLRSGVAYRTRLLVVRPRDLRRFSGNVRAIAFHNLGAASSVERQVLRNGDAWIGIEVSNGTKFGPDETLSGGMAQLHRFSQERYGALFLPGGEPTDWPDLTLGNLGRTAAQLDFGDRDSYPMKVFLQEIHRGYAQGPDILSQLVRILKEGAAGSPLAGAEVRRTFSYGASGGTTFLTPYIEYHHDCAMLADGRPPFDGYLIMVGMEPVRRPQKAIMVFLNSEAEALGRSLPLPPDTDDPRFRYYEIPGAGHTLSAPVEKASSTERSVQTTRLQSIVPAGVAGLTDRGAPSEHQAYDKINAPIIWGVWANMYDWLEHDKAMPLAPPIVRDPAAADGVARDEHGNALGGIRTPWVAVPDARYIARLSRKNPLAAGMAPFDEAKMTELYGSREAYLERVNARVDELVRDGWVLPQDAGIMKLRA